MEPRDNNFAEDHDLIKLTWRWSQSGRQRRHQRRRRWRNPPWRRKWRKGQLRQACLSTRIVVYWNSRNELEAPIYDTTWSTVHKKWYYISFWAYFYLNRLAINSSTDGCVVPKVGRCSDDSYLSSRDGGGRGSVVRKYCLHQLHSRASETVTETKVRLLKNTKTLTWIALIL